MSVIAAILVHKSFNSAGHSIIAGKAIMLLQKLLFLHKKCGDAKFLQTTIRYSNCK
jgi:Flp pilus assembly protein protease CpaA